MEQLPSSCREILGRVQGQVLSFANTSQDLTPGLGKGLAVKSCLDMSDDLLSGKVVSVMPEFKARSTELWLVCPSRQSITPAVRLLRDSFKEKTRGILKQLIEKGILDDSVLS